MKWQRDIRTKLRPEEVIALIFLAAFGVAVASCRFSPIWDPITVLIYLAPALMIGAIAAVSQRSGRKLWRVVRDFLPFLLVIWGYENMHLVTETVHFEDKHRWLIAADEWMFRGVNPVVWVERWVTSSLTNLMSAAYAGHFFFTPVLAMVLYRRGQIEGFRDTMLAIVMTLLVGFIGYVVVPSLAPCFTMRERFSVSLQGSPLAQKALDLYTISALEVPRDCFPSLHTAVTLVALMFAWRLWRGYFWVLLPCAAALVFSTVYLRLHYVIDLVAAVPLAAFSVWATPRLNRWWYSGAPLRAAGEAGLTAGPVAYSAPTRLPA
jgi:membrane-associated phospholipid phosphatase